MGSGVESFTNNEVTKSELYSSLTVIRGSNGGGSNDRLYIKFGFMGIFSDSALNIFFSFFLTLFENRPVYRGIEHRQYLFILEIL
ncbi:hypothetical protein TUM3792_42990 [Shewanella sp. MBTL60-007]|nr:hypothetical protein TUM3792_42990 [Shewanella sp. MBTL60-007]